MTRSALDELPLPLRRAPEWVDAVLGLLAAVLAVAVLLSADAAAIDPELHPPSAAVVAVTAIGAAGAAASPLGQYTASAVHMASAIR